MADDTVVNILNILDWIWYGIQSLIFALYRNVIPESSQQKESFNRKRALITGAGGGIGRNIALNLAKKGCNLVLWDIIEDANTKTAELCKDIGVEVYHEVVDVTNRNQVYEHAKIVLEKYNYIDILFNNAGVISDSKFGFLKCSDEKIEKLMQVNTISHFWTVKAFLPSMIERKKGHIASLASAAGITGTPGLVDYCASKFAAVGFMEALENEIHCQGYENIQFTTICPSFVDTSMINNVNTFDQKLLNPEKVADVAINAIQLKRHIVFLPSKINYVYALKGLIPWNLWRTTVFRKKFQFA